MRLSPLKNQALAAAVGSDRAAAAAPRAMRSASAAALKSYAAPAAVSSARNGVQAQATASRIAHSSCSSSSRAAARRRTSVTSSIPSSSPLLLLSRKSDSFSPLRALPTATSPSEATSPRQRSPKVTTTSFAVPAPPSLQRQRSSSSAATLLNRAPLPAPPADGAPLAYEIIKGAMVSSSLAVTGWRLNARQSNGSRAKR